MTILPPLTRYLYFKDEVMASLLFSFFENNLQEALFWAYELYFSGFEDETLRYIEKIYEDFYQTKNPKLAKSLGKTAWNLHDDPSEYWHLGTILRNMVGKSYELENMEYNSPKTAKNFYIVLTEKDVISYASQEFTGRPWKFLQSLTNTYETKKTKMDLFYTWYYDNAPPPNYNWKSREHALRKDWLPCAAQSPIWKTRLEQFGYSTEFPTEDAEEEFSSKYEYDIDEQPSYILLQRVPLDEGSGLIQEFSFKSLP